MQSRNRTDIYVELILINSMNLRSELARVKQRVKNGEDDIDKSFDFENVILRVYVQQGYLVFEIPDTDGSPHTPDINRINKTVTTTFDTVMLPSPQTGSLKSSVKISEIK